MARAVFILFLPLFSPFVAAQSADVQRIMHDSTVHVANLSHKDGQFRLYLGSGVVVQYKDRVFVTTNHHVVEDNHELTLNIEQVPLADRGAATLCKAEVLVADAEMDIAVLQPGIAIRGGAKVGKFSYEKPAFVAGFGAAPKCRFHSHPLRLRQARGHGGLGQRWSWVDYSGVLCHGDSGGGVYTPQGEVIGMCWGRLLEQNREEVGAQRPDDQVYTVVGAPYLEALDKAAAMTAAQQ